MSRAAAGGRTRAWLARLAFAAAAASLYLVLASAGGGGFLLVVAGIGGLATTLAGGWWFLGRRGAVRWVGGALATGAPIGMVVLCARLGLLWAALLWFTAVGAGRAALARPGTRRPEVRVPAPHHPYLIMNRASGGGKVARFHLVGRARGLGAEVALLDTREHTDVAAMAQTAAARGADLLGVAGGDGTQARVAAVDLGHAEDRAFVNNASFGAYAELVRSPDYRDGKTRTALDRLPDLLSGKGNAGLVACAGGVRIESPQAVLVSCNPYQVDDLAALGRRTRLGGGVLGVLAVRISSALQAAELMRGARAPGLTRLSAERVAVDADAPRIPMGIDGEATVLATPVRCAIRSGALRVRVPRHRCGIRPGRMRYAGPDG